MNKLKIFTFFTGVGSQEMALKNLKIDFEIVGISEVDKWALIAYDAIHNNNEQVEIKTKEEMLEEFNKKNISYNFSTNKSEIPRNIKDIEKLYKAHIRNKNWGDITKINPEKLPDFDFMTYSFPCKDISVAGQQKGFEKGGNKESKSALLWECEKIIKTKKPDYLMMENVKNLLSENHKKNFSIWVQVLDEIGYNSYYQVLNAKDYGVPQNRERVIMISIKKNIDKGFTFPEKEKLEYNLYDILEPKVDKKYYKKPETYRHLLKDFPIKKTAYCLDAHKYKGISVENFLKKKKRNLVCIGLLNTKGLESNRRVYDSIGLSPALSAMQGGNRQPKIKVYPIMNPNIKNKSQNSRRIKNENEEMFTLTVQNRHGIVETDQELNVAIRAITPLESWRLMGFSDEDFYKSKKAGLSETKLYERAGRGIVVTMLERIFFNLFNLEKIDNQLNLFGGNQCNH